MRKKMMKAVKELNDYIDNDREKLCDKLHDLELSHKRLESLVRAFVKAARSQEMDMDYFGRLVMRAEAELMYPYYRLNSRKLPDLHEYYGKDQR